jgi:hypothetical protein
MNSRLNYTIFLKKTYLKQNLERSFTHKHSKLLVQCRQKISLDPILWLPMVKAERSRCIRWRLGCLPGRQPRDCPHHPGVHLSKSHAILCLNMHKRLYMPESIADPLSFLLNQLPTHPPTSSRLLSKWLIRWPSICHIPHDLDNLFHNKPVSPIDVNFTHGQLLLEWLSFAPSPCNS